MFDLSRKSVLVAGGAGYLGKAVCAALARQGAKVTIADLAADRAAALAAQLNAADGTAVSVELDGADEISINRAVQHTVETFGRLDVLVNATYGAAGKTLEDLTAEDFDRASRINLTGMFLSARAAAGVMSEGGSIILFTSMYGQVSPDPRVYHSPMNPNPIEYGVGKAAEIAGPVVFLAADESSYVNGTVINVDGGWTAW